MYYIGSFRLDIVYDGNNKKRTCSDRREVGMALETNMKKMDVCT